MNQLSYFTIVVALLFVILMEAWRRFKSSRNLPPGPRKLPIIGNLHQFVGSMPHRRLRDLANKYGPVMHIQLGQLSNVVISSPELAKEVTKTHDHIFASRPSILAGRVFAYNERDIVSSPYGDHWRQLRKICTLELFSTKRVQSFSPIREEEVSYLVKSISSSVGVPVNLSRMVVALSYCIVSRAAFGKALNQNDAFTPLIQETLSYYNSFMICDLFPSIKILEVLSGVRSKCKKLHQEIDIIIEDIIREHRERKKCEKTEADDLVNVLLNLHEQGKFDVPLTIEDIKAVIMDMFLGGVETSSTTIEWAMSEMLKHPKVMKRAQEEVRRVLSGKEQIDETNIHSLTYLNVVIKETLRLHPPPILAREAQEGVELCGYKIPKGTRVMVNVWAIGRDPQHWNEPERFHPERFVNNNVDNKGTHFEYIPFGAGRRMCAGILFATAVVEIVLAHLLYHFDWMVPNGVKPEDLDMSETFGVVNRKKEDLCLIPTTYDP